MEDTVIREATPEDKEAVLNIRDDVYGGRDYLPAFYDNFMSSSKTTAFVSVYKGNIVGFSAVTVIDNGHTMVSRAGRVSKEHVGAGFSRNMSVNAEDWSIARHIGRKTTVASEDHLADLTKPSLQNIFKHILTKEVLQYPLDPEHLKIIQKNETAVQGPIVVTDDLLVSYIRSKTISQYLFPKDRIVVNSVPYRVLESNIPLLKEQGDMTVILSDVNTNSSSPQGILSIGTIFPVRNPSYAFNIEIYGSDYPSIRAHIVKHLIRLKDIRPKLTSVYVFVDEDFPFAVVDKIFLEFGISRTIFRVFTKRYMFEKLLQPASRY